MLINLLALEKTYLNSYHRDQFLPPRSLCAGMHQHQAYQPNSVAARPLFKSVNLQVGGEPGGFTVPRSWGEFPLPK
eukprot:742859-Pelagomonas_calceolata.AAC.5